MNPTTNPTNTYTVPSVSIATARTGASSKANKLGMRAKHVAQMLLSGEADIGIATEALAPYPQLVTLCRVTAGLTASWCRPGTRCWPLKSR